MNFYESTINRRLNNIKNPKIKQPQSVGTIQSTTTVDNKGFKCLDVELSLPFSYDFNKWNISLTPTFAIPFNKISTTSVNTRIVNGVSNIASVNSTPYSENHLTNIFFFDLGPRIGTDFGISLFFFSLFFGFGVSCSLVFWQELFS
jgi:hypothetical protein